MFPYLTPWILGFAICVFLVNMLMVIPYGKFSRSELPLQIDSRIAWALQHGLVLIGLIFGWVDLDGWYFNTPQTNKGWAALTFLWIHFLWRGILSQIIFTKHGKKQTTLILPLLGLLYFIPIGMNFRKMCYEIDEDYEAVDTIPLGLAFVCLILNIVIEMLYDSWRKSYENCYQFNLPTRIYYGNYLRHDFLEERFAIYRYGIHTPNYTFEVLEWLFFTLFVFRFEAFWWFVGTLLLLWARGAWTSHWLGEIENTWNKNNSNDKKYSF